MHEWESWENLLILCVHSLNFFVFSAPALSKIFSLPCPGPWKNRNSWPGPSRSLVHMHNFSLFHSNCFIFFSNLRTTDFYCTKRYQSINTSSATTRIVDIFWQLGLIICDRQKFSMRQQNVASVCMSFSDFCMKYYDCLGWQSKCKVTTREKCM